MGPAMAAGYRGRLTAEELPGVPGKLETAAAAGPAVHRWERERENMPGR